MQEKQTKVSVPDLHSLLTSLALYIREWVVLFILNVLPFLFLPLLREGPSAHFPQPFPLCAGHYVSAASCLQSWWQEKGCLLPERGGQDVTTRSPFLPHTSRGLSRLPGVDRSMWYPVSGLPFWAGAWDNITVSTEHLLWVSTLTLTSYKTS